MFLKNCKLSGGVWREEKEKCNYNLITIITIVRIKNTLEV